MWYNIFSHAKRDRKINDAIHDMFSVCVVCIQNEGADEKLLNKKEMTLVKNVLGQKLTSCCQDPLTGFYRDGFCYTGPQDYGTHVVCARVTDAFLEYSKAQGNDLMSPRPEYSFPGLKDGDTWCLCVSRWLEAEKAGVAPLINLSATHAKALEYTTIELLKKYAL